MLAYCTYSKFCYMSWDIFNSSHAFTTKTMMNKCEQTKEYIVHQCTCVAIMYIYWMLSIITRWHFMNGSFYGIIPWFPNHKTWFNLDQIRLWWGWVELGLVGYKIHGWLHGAKSKPVLWLEDFKVSFENSREMYMHNGTSR